MSTTTILSNRDFIIRFINKCSIVRGSRLDTTIKAIINSYNKGDREEVVGYLNKLRIVYYLKRLEYKDTAKAKVLKSKSLLFYLLSFLLIY